MAGETFSQADLRAIVDMGSNGIRFSITDMSPLTARTLPTVYTDRAGISLYVAMYTNGQQGPIPDPIIKSVVNRLLRFKSICQDFGVLESNIRVLATEATRTAPNSEIFRQQIKEATGWEVELLPKEEEGRVGAMGIASSLPEINGLAMDLGGGSTQIIWIVNDHGRVKMNPKGSISLPYGAAAISLRLKEAGKFGKVAQHRLKQSLKETIRLAYIELNVPEELTEAAKKDGGFSLYLSGGGFRGWGHVLMSQHRIKPYPISTINGFRVKASSFKDTANVESVVKEDSIFRISERRASQVPAVAFLINALIEELPQIKDVRFCQGGVREGSLFLTLPDSIRAQNPLVAGTLPYAPPSSQHLLRLLDDANPEPKKSVSLDLLTALVNMMYHHAPHTKETRASAALRCTTSGVLAPLHGIDHHDRAMLALMLCERWDGKVPPTDTDFLASMQQLAGPENSWWAKYFGRIAAHICEVYSTGAVDEEHPKLQFEAVLSNAVKKGRMGEVTLIARHLGDRRGVDDPVSGGDVESYGETVKDILKLGNKKQWVEGYGNKVDVQIT